MGISVNDVVAIMLKQAQQTAGNAWNTARPVIESEFKNFGQQLAQVAAGLASGELTEQDAKDFVAAIRNNMVATIALAVNIGQAAVQQIINAALTAAKDAIN